MKNQNQPPPLNPNHLKSSIQPTPTFQKQKHHSAVRSDIMGSIKKNIPRDNLTEDERHAMKTLIEAQRNGQIQIKAADKGRGICIMDTADYKKKCTTN